MLSLGVPLVGGPGSDGVDSGVGENPSDRVACIVVAAGIVRLLRDLDKQARKEGGAVYMLNGNHESLNVCGDFRYAAQPVPGSWFSMWRRTATRCW